MLFPDDALFDSSLFDFAKDIDARAALPVTPLPCDRWIARSCLQKAIRRGDPQLGQRALANLFNHDRRAAWRHLAIIALEDVGVANLDVLSRILAAQRNRRWREQMGGDWPVMAELVRQMAVSEHCQAACDLLLKISNDPQLEQGRSVAVEAEMYLLAPTISDRAAPLVERGIAALAMGGGLEEGQPHNDPAAVFDLVAETSHSTHAVATCRAAWKMTRNPMALLLPLVWDHWSQLDQHEVSNDALQPSHMIRGVPAHSLDQFTRIGNIVSRALLRSDPVLRQLLADAGIIPAAQSRAVGDLLFLQEGGLLTNRVIWLVGDQLRLPDRQLPTVSRLRSNLPPALAHIRSKARHIAQLREQYLHSGSP